MAVYNDTVVKVVEQGYAPEFEEGGDI